MKEVKIFFEGPKEIGTNDASLDYVIKVPNPTMAEWVRSRFGIEDSLPKGAGRIENAGVKAFGLYIEGDFVLSESAESELPKGY